MIWIETVELFILLWPFIKKILDKIADEKERDETANKVTTLIGKYYTGELTAESPGEVIAALWEPLKLVA